MALDKVVADTGVLYCDDAEIGPVEFAITVRREDGAGRTSATGYLRGAMNAVDACRKASVAELATRHFGRVLIQLHRIDGMHAYFDLAEPFAALGVDAPQSPDLAGAPDGDDVARDVEDHL